MNTKKTPTTMLRILIKEDILIYRKGICESIEESFPGAYYHAISGDAELAEEAASKPWDLIIVGTMSFQETFLAINHVKKIAPHIPLVILEDEVSSDNFKKVEKMGADVYLGKNSKIEHIVQAIQKAAAIA